MILQKIIETLQAGLGCYVGVQSPETGDRFVLIDQTGSQRRNHLNTVTVAIQSYGPTLADALSINASVEQVMMNRLLADDLIAAVKFNTDYNFTNPETKEYRWQAVYDITYYHQEV